VTLRLDAPLADIGSGPTNGIAVDQDDPRVLRVRLRDVAVELPPLLERVHRGGRSIEDVDVRGPSLQAVFIHLTGRELRE
jgi:hypothetical protein